MGGKLWKRGEEKKAEVSDDTSDRRQGKRRDAYDK